MTQCRETHSKKYDLTGILLVNLGTPADTRCSSIFRYLRDFLSDPRVIKRSRWLWLPLLYGVILPLRIRPLQRMYKGIANERGLPLRYITEDLAHAVDDALAPEEGKRVSVRAAMTYGGPSISSVLEEWCADGLTQLKVVPLFPHYSEASTAPIYDQLACCFRNRPFLPSLEILSGYADHPAYITSVSKHIRRYLPEKMADDEVVIFSYHGLPAKSLENGDPYYCYCRKTTRLLVETLGLEETQYRFAFQSRFGREEWLRPYVDDVLKELVSEGVKKVHFVCPGFAVDCSETLDEIEKGYCKRFVTLGGEKASYIPALNASPEAVAMLVDMLQN